MSLERDNTMEKYKRRDCHLLQRTYGQVQKLMAAKGFITNLSVRQAPSGQQVSLGQTTSQHDGAIIREG